MKHTKEVTAAVIDYGTFISLSERLSDTFDTVYYYSPFEAEFADVRDCCRATGLNKVKRLDDFMEPEIYDSIDLWIFPDVNYTGLQRFLRRDGKAVWGSMGASDLELYRTYFLDVLNEVGLPYVKSKTCHGLTALSEYLKQVKNKWVKINRYRQNMETWHHLDYDHSVRMLDSLAVVFGGQKEEVTFVVQDDIESDMEIGYDGWNVLGRFPSKSFQGYEKKNQLYLGSLLNAEELPEEVNYVNEAMTPILEECGYCNFWATEIRIKDKVPYFIDPTARLAGQTMEHQFKSCSNLPDVIWHGANGDLIEPEFDYRFAAEATLHYDALTEDIAVAKEWKTLKIQKEAMRWICLYHYCVVDGVYHFPPSKTDEVGVVVGLGDSVEDSIDHLRENLELLKDLPVHADVSGFVDLLKSIQDAEDEGLHFSDNVPEPEIIIKD